MKLETSPDNTLENALFYRVCRECEQRFYPQSCFCLLADSRVSPINETWPRRPVHELEATLEQMPPVLARHLPSIMEYGRYTSNRVGLIFFEPSLGLWCQAAIYRPNHCSAVCEEGGVVDVFGRENLDNTYAKLHGKLP